MLHFQPVDIAVFMGTQGLRYTTWRVNEALDYIQHMINDNRVILIEDVMGIHTVIMFSVCHNFTPFYMKKTWEYMSHKPDGKILYVEKAVSRGWNKELREKMRELFLNKYPQLQTAKWHRWDHWGDRPVTVKRSKYVKV